MEKVDFNPDVIGWIVSPILCPYPISLWMDPDVETVFADVKQLKWGQTGEGYTQI